MNSYLLQDWLTLTADTTGHAVDIAQPAPGWLDLGHASDVTFFLEVPAVTVGGSVLFEASPTRDSSQFQTLQLVDWVASPTPAIYQVALYNNPTVPLARWVRWRAKKAINSGMWTVMFRITVMAYPR